MISTKDAILEGIETECESDCKKERNNDGGKHDNNNDQNGYRNRSSSIASVRKEDPYLAKRSGQSNCGGRQPRSAPLVSWHNGSPTIRLSSLRRQSVVDRLSDNVHSPSKSCNIREICNLDLTDDRAEGSIDAIESLELVETIERGRPTSGARSSVATNVTRRREIGSEGEEYAVTAATAATAAVVTDKIKGTRTNEGRVKDSIDSLSISEREDSLSFIRERGVARDDGRDDGKKAKVPDGGWGWVVVLASLVISMIADGVSFSFGLLYIEFLHEFGASKSKTAWIGSLFMAVPLLSGPIMSALVDRYGCRNMTIAGGLISGFGFILSIFSNTIEIMYLTFGVIAGLGLGMCYVTAVVSIAFWFDKKRTLAVGLGACGTGIGTFVYAPMTTYFIEEYGWRGACLLLAGTFFNMIVAGTVMRDPEWWILEQRKQDQALLAKKSHGRSDGSSSDEFPGVEELRKLLRSDHAPQYFLQNLSTSTKAVDGGKRQTTSVVNLPTFVKRSEKVRNYERG